MTISINGKIVDSKKAHLLITDKAFLCGFAVFETMRTYNGGIFKPDDHLKRLYASAAALGMMPKWGLKKAKKAVTDMLKKNKRKNSRIRIILTEDKLIVTAERLAEKPESFYKNGVKLVSYAGRRSVPEAKVLGDVLCFLANRYAKERGAYESVLVDPDTSFVRECSYANIFWVKNGKLHTTEKNILKGITRETVIGLAGQPDKGLAGGCAFKEIRLKSLMSADEVFITQTTSGLLPVRAIDGVKIGSGRPGPVTRELLRKFRELVK